MLAENKQKSIQFDAIIVGAGQAGPPMADRLSRAGWRVAVIERKLFGGTCVNVGCTPTKALIASAHAAHIARRADDFGIERTQPVSVNMRQVMDRKDKIVQKSRAGLENWLHAMKNVTLFTEPAYFQSSTSIRVGDILLEAPHIFLNVGARPEVPHLPGIASTPFHTSSTLLTLQDLPSHLIVVGGGYVGLEFAQMYRRFGSEVTVVERGPRLLVGADDDAVASTTKTLVGEGITFRLDAECIAIRGSPGDVAVELGCREGARKVEGSHILIATGRRPNTDDLQLGLAAVEQDERGYIQVDDTLQTSTKGIWALGDCNGRGGFTHTSYNDYEIVADNLLEGKSRRVSDRIPVSALYVDPPVAQVGQTAAQLLRDGRPALVSFRPMTKVGRAVEKGETDGFIKVLVDATTLRVLGATIVGPGADEAIHCVLTAMYAGGNAHLLTNSVHIHPTVAELIPTVFGELVPLANA